MGRISVVIVLALLAGACQSTADREYERGYAARRAEAQQESQKREEEARKQEAAVRTQFDAWYEALTTAQRVQFNDWVRAYQMYRFDLYLPQEDSIYKATQLCGKPEIPPVVPQAISTHVTEALQMLHDQVH